jgi:hypothetical protein
VKATPLGHVAQCGVGTGQHGCLDGDAATCTAGSRHPGRGAHEVAVDERTAWHRSTM